MFSGVAMVTVKVKFFGIVRDITRAPVTEIEVDDDATVLDLLQALQRECGQSFSDAVLSDVNGLQSHVMLFMNDEEVNRWKLGETKVVGPGGGAEAIVYVIPSAVGG
jgi:molybdopterin converting factor small subunit